MSADETAQALGTSPGVELGDGQRLAVAKALQLRTPGVAQKVCLRGSLHAFGDHFLVEAASHDDDRAGDRVGIGVGGELMHERAIDLQHVNGKVAQVRQAAVAGAEIIQRQAQQRGGDFATGHHHAFGHFQLQQLRVDAGFLQGVRQLAVKARVLELQG